MARLEEVKCMIDGRLADTEYYGIFKSKLFVCVELLWAAIMTCSMIKIGADM